MSLGTKNEVMVKCKYMTAHHVSWNCFCHRSLRASFIPIVFSIRVQDFQVLYDWFKFFKTEFKEILLSQYCNYRWQGININDMFVCLSLSLSLPPPPPLLLEFQLASCYRAVSKVGNSCFWVGPPLSENISQLTTNLLSWNSDSFSLNVIFHFMQRIWIHISCLSMPLSQIIIAWFLVWKLQSACVWPFTGLLHSFYSVGSILYILLPLWPRLLMLNFEEVTDADSFGAKCIQLNKEGSFETLLQNMWHGKNNAAGFVSYNPTPTLPCTRIHRTVA